jgi:hypothetical protein
MYMNYKVVCHGTQGERVGGILVQTNVKIMEKMALVRCTLVYHHRWEMIFFKESNALFKKKVGFCKRGLN